MQTWIRANIGKLIARITSAESAISDLTRNVYQLSGSVGLMGAKLNFITAGTNHNAIFGGRDLTNVYTVNDMYDKIHNRNFEDLYVGDYFTKSITTDIYTHFTGESFESGTTYYEMSGTINDRVWTVTEDETPQEGKIYATKLTKTENVDLMFAAFNYYLNMGDTALTVPHAVLIPKTAFATTAKMNPTNTTTGGYYNSDMNQIVLPCYAKSLKTALGNHLLSHRTWLSTSNNAGTWADTELQLMNEKQIYSTNVYGNAKIETGLDGKILPVFNFINSVQYDSNSLWLRPIAGTTNFARCGSDGNPSAYGASNALYVRPLIIFG